MCNCRGRPRSGHDHGTGISSNTSAIITCRALISGTAAETTQYRLRPPHSRLLTHGPALSKPLHHHGSHIPCKTQSYLSPAHRPAHISPSPLQQNPSANTGREAHLPFHCRPPRQQHLPQQREQLTDDLGIPPEPTGNGVQDRPQRLHQLRRDMRAVTPVLVTARRAGPRRGSPDASTRGSQPGRPVGRSPSIRGSSRGFSYVQKTNRLSKLLQRLRDLGGTDEAGTTQPTEERRMYPLPFKARGRSTAAR